MKKRWEFNPVPWIVLWAVGGLIGLFVTAIAGNSCGPQGCGMNGPWTGAESIEVSIWAAPFVLYLLGSVLLIAMPRMITTLWQARPRRIEEPVLEDLRQVK